MNDDLKAYIDGELPPDAADRLHAALEADAALVREAEAFRQISQTLRSLPSPEPVGQAETLAALSRPRRSLLPSWGFALAACAGVLAVASFAGSPRVGKWDLAGVRKSIIVGEPPIEVTLPAVRRQAFIRFIHERGGQVNRYGAGVRVFYNSDIQGEMTRRFLLPDSLPYAADGLRVRFTR